MKIVLLSLLAIMVLGVQGALVYRVYVRPPTNQWTALDSNYDSIKADHIYSVPCRLQTIYGMHGGAGFDMEEATLSRCYINT